MLFFNILDLHWYYLFWGIVLDLFSGMGSASRSFYNKGFKISYAVDQFICTPPVDASTRIFHESIEEFLNNCRVKADGYPHGTNMIDHIHCGSRFDSIRGSESSEGKEDEMLLFCKAIEIFHPKTASIVLLSCENPLNAKCRTYKNFNNTSDFLALEDLVFRLLALSYQLSINPLQSELYGSPQKCKRYIVYAAAISIPLPFQGSETHVSKPGEPFHCKSAFKAIQDLAHVPPTDEAFDHVAITASVSISQYPKLDKRVPWSYNPRDLPIRHPEQQRLLTIREHARIFSIPDFVSIPGESMLEKLQNITNSLPSILGNVIATSVLKSYKKEEKSPYISINSFPCDFISL